MLCNVLSTLEKTSSFHSSQPTEKITIIIPISQMRKLRDIICMISYKTLQEMLLEDCSHRKYAA